MTAPSISIANNLLQKTFTQQSTAEIEMISTLPNFGVLLLILFADTIANKFGIKRTITYYYGWFVDVPFRWCFTCFYS